jgi:hypothetical protein
MDGYEKEKSPYHGLWVNCLLIVGVPTILYFIFLGMFREYQRGADELHVMSARVLAGGVGVLFHLSLWIAGVFRESIRAVTRRVSEFFEDLSISIGFAARDYWYNIKTDGAVLVIYLALIGGTTACFVDALLKYLAMVQ